MDSKMFCFQCEQTAGLQHVQEHKAYVVKKADTAKLQELV